MRDALSMLLVMLGVVFFVAGTVGLLRFPDTFSRLHALTKADNLGLGFVVVGVALQAHSLFQIAKLVLIWGLVLVAAGTVSQLIARSQLSHKEGDDDV
jgi:multicomponent Na+:H+ antiporter subunit G